MLSKTSLPERIFSKVITEHTFPPIQLVDMLITEDCNCRCDYCFIEGKRPKRMTEEIVKATVDFLLVKSTHLKRVEILFFGGEPLMAFDLIRLTVDYGRWRAACIGKDLAFSMTTNGTLLDEEKLAFLRKHRIKFLLSIDGDRETHNRHRKFADGRGTYDAIASKIPLMKAYQPWLGARVTPTPENMHKLSENVKHLFSLGINQFIVGPATGLYYSDEVIEVYREEILKVGRFYMEMRKRKAPIRMTMFEDEGDGKSGSKRGIWGCGAGRGRISVSASGEIQPCAKVQGLNNLEGIPAYTLGNVLDGFVNLDARSEFVSFAYEKRTACHFCDLKDDCAGGCPAVNYDASGCIWLPDPCECKITRVLLEVKRQVLQQMRKIDETPVAS